MAALRGFKGNTKTVKLEIKKGEAAKLGMMLGEKDGVWVEEVDAMAGPTLREKNEAMGSWYETDKSGNKVAVSEPSFHCVVEGSEREINRRAAYLGRKFNQQAVAVAVHDASAKDQGVFSVSLSGSGIGDNEMEAITQSFLDRGLGGATTMLEKRELKLLAAGPGDIDIIDGTIKLLPKEFKPTQTFQPARVRFLDATEYAELLKAEADVATVVVADVIVMGLWPRPTVPNPLPI